MSNSSNKKINEVINICKDQTKRKKLLDSKTKLIKTVNKMTTQSCALCSYARMCNAPMKKEK